MNKRTLFVIVVLRIAAMLLVACGGGGQTESEPTVEQGNMGEEVQGTGGEPAQADTQEAGPVEETSPSGPVMPEDVPLFEGARDLQVTEDQTNIGFVIDNIEIIDVVSWYQEQLPIYNWEMGRNPDSALGSMATMVRQNANGDRISISMQYNQIGGFVVVQINLNRAPTP